MGQQQYLRLGVDAAPMQEGARIAVRSLEEIRAKARETAGGVGATESSLDKLKRAAGLLTGAMGALGIGFSALKLADLVRDSALLSARYETLGVAMNVVGRNAGYSRAELEGFDASLRRTGISMIESRQAIANLASAGIDLTNATQLARIAQDAAVIGGINSSEAFNRLTTGITTAQTEILRGIGITVNFENAYKQLRSEIGPTADKLDEAQKMQARVNVVLGAGAGIAGTYEAAMGTAGKQIGSLSRLMEDLTVKAGGVFDETLRQGVFGFSDALKSANEALDNLSDADVQAWGRTLADTLSDLASAGALVAGLFAGRLLGSIIASSAAWVRNAFAARAAAAATLEVAAANRAGALAELQMTRAMGTSTAARLAQAGAARNLAVGNAAYVAALGRVSIASRAAAAATGVFNGALALVGGPIGLAVIALGLLVAAYMKVKGAAREAAAAAKQAADDYRASLAGLETTTVEVRFEADKGSLATVQAQTARAREIVAAQRAEYRPQFTRSGNLMETPGLAALKQNERALENLIGLETKLKGQVRATFAELDARDKLAPADPVVDPPPVLDTDTDTGATKAQIASAREYLAELTQVQDALRALGVSDASRLPEGLRNAFDEAQRLRQEFERAREAIRTAGPNAVPGAAAAVATLRTQLDAAEREVRDRRDRFAALLGTLQNVGLPSLELAPAGFRDAAAEIERLRENVRTFETEVDRLGSAAPESLVRGLGAARAEMDRAAADFETRLAGLGKLNTTVRLLAEVEADTGPATAEVELLRGAAVRAATDIAALGSGTEGAAERAGTSVAALSAALQGVEAVPGVDLGELRSGLDAGRLLLAGADLSTAAEIRLAEFGPLLEIAQREIAAARLVVTVTPEFAPFDGAVREIETTLAQSAAALGVEIPVSLAQSRVDAQLDAFRGEAATLREARDDLRLALAAGDKTAAGEAKEQIEALEKQVQAARKATAAALRAAGLSAAEQAEALTEFDRISDESGAGAERARSSVQKYTSEFEGLARGVLSVADAMGVLGDQERQALQGAVDLAAGIGRIAAGDIVGGIAQGIGGAVGIVSGLFGDKGESEGARAQREAMERNTEALDRLRIEGFGETASDIQATARAAAGLSEADVNGIIRASLLENFERGKLGRSGALEVANLNDALAKYGVSFAELQKVAESNGIQLLDEKGFLVASAFDALDEVLGYVVKDLTTFGDSLSEQRRLREAERDIFEQPDTPLATLNQEVALGAALSPAIRDAFAGVDLGTAAGQTQADQILRDLFTEAKAGNLTLDQLGGFADVEEFLSWLLAAEAPLDALTGAAGTAAEKLLRFGDDLAGRRSLQDLIDRVFDVDGDPGRQLQNEMANLQALAPQLAERFAGLDASTEAGRLAIDTALQDLVMAIASGAITAEQLGGLAGVEELAGIIGNADSALDRFASTANKAADAVTDIPKAINLTLYRSRFGTGVQNAAPPTVPSPVVPVPLDLSEAVDRLKDALPVAGAGAGEDKTLRGLLDGLKSMDFTPSIPIFDGELLGGIDGLRDSLDRLREEGVEVTGPLADSLRELKENLGERDGGTVEEMLRRFGGGGISAPMVPASPPPPPPITPPTGAIDAGGWVVNGPLIGTIVNEAGDTPEDFARKVEAGFAAIASKGGTVLLRGARVL